MSNDRSNFDPRFDPAFQRGFDGEVEVVVTERVPDRVPDRVTERVAESAIVELAPSAPAVSEPGLIEASEPDARGGRINPYLVALGAVSVALVAGGLYLVSRLREFFDSSQTTTDFDFVILQVLLYAAPLIVVLGVATAIGMVFLAAARWER
jgi:hypothetical protein